MRHDDFIFQPFTIFGFSGGFAEAVREKGYMEAAAEYAAEHAAEKAATVPILIFDCCCCRCSDCRIPATESLHRKALAAGARDGCRRVSL